MSQKNYLPTETTTTTKDDFHTHTTNPPKGGKQMTMAWGGYGEKKFLFRKRRYF